MGIDPISLGIVALVAGSFFAGSAIARGRKKREDISPAPISSTVPIAPITAEATPEQKAKIRRKTKTILTRPLTGEEKFGISPPTLLGLGDPTKSPVVG